MTCIAFAPDWPRRETYLHYRQNPCSCSVTQGVAVTCLREQSKAADTPFTPTLIHALCRAVNRLPALRMTVQDDQVGYWSQICPAYTVFHPETQTFSAIWSEYTPDFESFLANYQADIAAHGNAPQMFPKGHLPAQSPNISITPWLDFSAFNLAFQGREDYLLPVFTLGRFSGEERITLPVSVQANHAACDGVHIAQFFEAFQAELQAKRSG